MEFNIMIKVNWGTARVKDERGNDVHPKQGDFVPKLCHLQSHKNPRGHHGASLELWIHPGIHQGANR